MRTRRAARRLAIGAVVLALSACGDPEVDPPAAAPETTAPGRSVAPETAAPETTAPETVPPPTGPAPVAIVAVHHDVAYYGACGNETVDVAGTTYYPLYDDERAAFDDSLYQDQPAEEVTASTSAGLLRVVAPGPGDDIGTFLVYADGMARFESDSGRVIWLTRDEHSYNWVC